MTKRIRWALAGLGAILALATGAVAAAPPPGKPLGEFFLGPKLARAEVVLVVRGQVHDYRIDRGRVKSAARGSLELRELDGTIQVVPVADDATIELNGRLIAFSGIRRGVVAVTIRDGDAPAERVILSPPARAR